VGEIDVVVAPEPAKVGNDPLSGLEAVVVERPALPLGEGEGHLELDVLKVPGRKCCGTLDAVLTIREKREKYRVSTCQRREDHMFDSIDDDSN
jgi:hypothetical protein